MQSDLLASWEKYTTKENGARQQQWKCTRYSCRVSPYLLVYPPGISPLVSCRILLYLPLYNQYTSPCHASINRKHEACSCFHASSGLGCEDDFFVYLLTADIDEFCWCWQEL